MYSPAELLIRHAACGSFLILLHTFFCAAACGLQDGGAHSIELRALCASQISSASSTAALLLFDLSAVPLHRTRATTAAKRLPCIAILNIAQYAEPRACCLLSVEERCAEPSAFLEDVQDRTILACALRLGSTILCLFEDGLILSYGGCVSSWCFGPS